MSERHDVYSIRIGIHWRALGYRGQDETGQAVMTWFWIGSHADYDRMVVGL